MLLGEVGITRIVLDAAQTAGVLPIHAERMGVDLLAVPGHKSLMGPTGTGALYVGPRATLRAWREGGTGGDSFSETQPTKYPFFLEGVALDPALNQPDRLHPNAKGVQVMARRMAAAVEEALEDIEE